MNDDGIVWIDGWPTERKSDLPCGRVFFDVTNALLDKHDTQFGCRGKVQYESGDDALREIHRLMVESMSNTTFLRTYKCKYCKKWHFTSRDS